MSLNGHGGTESCRRCGDRDLDTFYDDISVVAAPYLVGGGVKMKVLEAMARGLPVAGLPAAFRGITVEPQTSVCWCESVHELADGLAGLLRDLQRASARGMAARDAILSRRCGKAADEGFSRLVARLAV